MASHSVKKEHTHNTRLSPLSVPIQVLEALTRAARQRQEFKRVQIRKEEVRVSLFTDDMIVDISDPKNYTRKQLQLINTFSKLPGYQINSQKSVANDKLSEKEIKGNNTYHKSKQVKDL